MSGVEVNMARISSKVLRFIGTGAPVDDCWIGTTVEMTATLVGPKVRRALVHEFPMCDLDELKVNNPLLACPGKHLDVDTLTRRYEAARRSPWHVFDDEE